MLTGRIVGLGLAVLWAVSSCSQAGKPSDETERGGSAALRTEALTAPSTGLTVHPPFLLSERVLLPGGYTASPALACLENGCLAAWSQSNRVVARRLTSAGEPLGDRVIDIGESISGSAHLETVNGRYVLAWTGQQTHLTTISADGQLEGDRLTWAPYVVWNLVGLASSGDVAAVAYLSGDTQGFRVALRRFRNGALLGGEIDLGASTQIRAGIGSGGGQFAVTRDGELYRLDPETGTILGNGPTTFTKYEFNSSATGPVVSFDGANHLVSWFWDGTLYTSRIRASDGAPLEIDDDFNERTGARRICTNLGSVTDLWVGRQGDNIVYLLRSATGVRSVVLPLSAWNTVSTCPIQYLGQGGDRQTTSTSLGELTDAAAIQSDRVLRLLRSTADLRVVHHDLTQLPPSSDAAKVVNFHGPWVEPVGAASSGADFVAGYYDGDRKLWKVLRIDDETGNRIGPMLDYGTVGGQATRSLTLSSNGSSYLVASTAGTTRALQPLSCRGQLGQQKTSASSNDWSSIASDGNRYLLVDSARNVLRADAAGTLLEGPVLVAQHSVIDVAADRDPDPERRTFMVLMAEQNRAYAHRVRSATGVALPVVTTDEPNGINSPFLASTGADFLVGWVRHQDSAYSLRLALLNPLDAQPRATASLPVESFSITSVPRFATYDGTSLATWSGGGNLLARRWDADLTPVDTTDIETTIWNTTYRRVASNLKGRTLFVYSAFDPEQLGSAIYGQFVDSAAQASSLPEGVCDEVAGAVGTGGAGGVDGNGDGGQTDLGGSGGDGGTTGTGGGALGGGVNSGGVTSGGGLSAGGSVNAGQGGGLSSGGTLAEGGAPHDGGRAGAGGRAEAGASTEGGAPAMGGHGGTGANAGAGGESAGGESAGGAAIAGNSGASGAPPISGGSSGAGAGESTSDDQDEGCSCRMPRPRDTSSPDAMALAAFALLALAIKRRRTLEAKPSKAAPASRRHEPRST